MSIDSFIEDFYNTVRQYTDAPDDVIIANAYWVISGTLGLFFETRETPQPLRPNLFVLITGRAGITRKSTVMNYAETVYRIAWDTFYKRINLNVDIEDKFIEEFTVEGICDHIEPNVGTIMDYVLMTDEFGVWLTRANVQHLIGSKGILSKLYYGKGYKQTLSKRGGKKGERRIPEGLYVTMLAAMQDPELYLNDLDIKQGFLRRILIVPIKDDDLRDYKPPLMLERRFMHADLKQIALELADKMFKIYQNFTRGFNVIPVIIDPKIETLINEYDRKTHEMLRSTYSGESSVSGCLETSWEHILKLTILECIADKNKYPDMVAGEPVLMVDNPEYYNRAVTWFEKLKPKILDMVETISVRRNPAQINIVSDVTNRILGCISRKKNPISSKELLEAMQMRKDELKPYLVTLLAQEKLFAVYEKPPKGSRGGRPKILFFLDENDAKKYVASQINKEAVILSASAFEDLW